MPLSYEGVYVKHPPFHTRSNPAMQNDQLQSEQQQRSSSHHHPRDIVIGEMTPLTASSSHPAYLTTKQFYHTLKASIERSKLRIQALDDSVKAHRAKRSEKDDRDDATTAAATTATSADTLEHEQQSSLLLASLQREKLVLQRKEIKLGQLKAEYLSEKRRAIEQAEKKAREEEERRRKEEMEEQEEEKYPPLSPQRVRRPSSTSRKKSAASIVPPLPLAPSRKPPVPSRPRTRASPSPPPPTTEIAAPAEPARKPRLPLVPHKKPVVAAPVPPAPAPKPVSIPSSKKVKRKPKEHPKEEEQNVEAIVPAPQPIAVIAQPPPPPPQSASHRSTARSARSHRTEREEESSSGYSSDDDGHFESASPTRITVRASYHHPPAPVPKPQQLPAEPKRRTTTTESTNPPAVISRSKSFSTKPLPRGTSALLKPSLTSTPAESLTLTRKKQQAQRELIDGMKGKREEKKRKEEEEAEKKRKKKMNEEEDAKHEEARAAQQQQQHPLTLELEVHRDHHNSTAAYEAACRKAAEKNRDRRTSRRSKISPIDDLDSSAPRSRHDRAFSPHFEQQHCQQQSQQQSLSYPQYSQQHYSHHYNGTDHHQSATRSYTPPRRHRQHHSHDSHHHNYPSTSSFPLDPFPSTSPLPYSSPISRQHLNALHARAAYDTEREVHRRRKEKERVRKEEVRHWKEKYDSLRRSRADGHRVVRVVATTPSKLRPTTDLDAATGLTEEDENGYAQIVIRTSERKRRRRRDKSNSDHERRRSSRHRTLFPGGHGDASSCDSSPERRLGRSTHHSHPSHDHPPHVHNLNSTSFNPSGAPYYNIRPYSTPLSSWDRTVYTYPGFTTATAAGMGVWPSEREYGGINEKQWVTATKGGMEATAAVPLPQHPLSHPLPQSSHSAPPLTLSISSTSSALPTVPHTSRRGYILDASSLPGPVRVGDLIFDATSNQYVQVEEEVMVHEPMSPGNAEPVQCTRPHAYHDTTGHHHAESTIPSTQPTSGVAVLLSKLQSAVQRVEPALWQS